MKYTVGLKGTDNRAVIKANNELEAMTKYCSQNSFNYSLVAPKLEVVKDSSTNLEKGTNENSQRL